MADWHFTKADGWAALSAAHQRFVEDYNAQGHRAHRDRDDGRRSPGEVLGFVSGVRHREEVLRRAFFSARFARVLIPSATPRSGAGGSTARRGWPAGRPRHG